jgi:XRE family transcriptional regulator, regulator of sulfur utilization
MEAPAMALTIDRKAIGRRIHVLRWEKGWSLKDLEDASGVSQSMLSRYERGSHPASLERLGQIAEALGSSLQYLLDDTLTPSSLTRAA